MSIPSYTDEPDGTPPGRGTRSRLLKAAAAAAAAAALVFGAKAIAGDGTAGSTADAASGRPVPQPNGYGMPGGGRPGFGAGQGGLCGPGGRGDDGHAGPAPGTGFGADVTGATLSKLKDAVSAKYPGTVERAVKLPDGSYVVHVIRSGGSEVHVHVSKAFKVLGAQQGGPPGAPSASGHVS